MKPGTAKRPRRVKRLESNPRKQVRTWRQGRGVDGPKRLLREAAWAPHRRHKPGLLAYVFTADWRHVLCAPFIYPALLPMLLLDCWVTLYQWVCFPLCGMPRVRRSSFWVFDRARLPYLNGLEKVHCAYCSYANGLIAYCREVFGLTELYWCPIKHAHRTAGTHRHYPGFTDYGDADNYRAELSRLRAQLQVMRDQMACTEKDLS